LRGFDSPRLHHFLLENRQIRKQLYHSCTKRGHFGFISPADSRLPRTCWSGLCCRCRF